LGLISNDLQMDRHTIKDYYAHEIEANRLDMEVFKLEGIRTKEIIERYLQKDNLEILDVDVTDSKTVNDAIKTIIKNEGVFLSRG